MCPARSAARSTELSSKEPAAPTRPTPALWTERFGARPTMIGRLIPARAAAAPVGVFHVATALPRVPRSSSYCPRAALLQPTGASSRSCCASSFSDRPRCVCLSTLKNASLPLMTAGCTDKRYYIPIPIPDKPCYYHYRDHHRSDRPLDEPHNLINNIVLLN